MNKNVTMQAFLMNLSLLISAFLYASDHDLRKVHMLYDSHDMSKYIDFSNHDQRLKNAVKKFYSVNGLLKQVPHNADIVKSLNSPIPIGVSFSKYRSLYTTFQNTITRKIAIAALENKKPGPIESGFFAYLHESYQKGTTRMAHIRYTTILTLNKAGAHLPTEIYKKIIAYSDQEALVPVHSADLLVMFRIIFDSTVLSPYNPGATPPDESNVLSRFFIELYQ